MQQKLSYKQKPNEIKERNKKKQEICKIKQEKNHKIQKIANK